MDVEQDHGRAVALVALDADLVRMVDEAPREVLDERSEEHTSELQSPCNLVCRLLLEKKKPHRRLKQKRGRRSQCWIGRCLVEPTLRQPCALCCGRYDVAYNRAELDHRG